MGAAISATAKTSNRSSSRCKAARRSCCGTLLASNSGRTNGAAIAELNGEGEVVGGIVLQRDGQNALDVIDATKQKLAEMTSSLPEGVTVEAVYDRSDLIKRAIDTLKHTLAEESLVVAAVCVIFLLHVRSALVAILMLPVGVLIAMGLVAHARHEFEHYEPGRHRHRSWRHG